MNTTIILVNYETKETVITRGKIRGQYIRQLIKDGVINGMDLSGTKKELIVLEKT